MMVQHALLQPNTIHRIISTTSVEIQDLCDIHISNALNRSFSNLHAPFSLEQDTTPTEEDGDNPASAPTAAPGHSPQISIPTVHTSKHKISQTSNLIDTHNSPLTLLSSPEILSPFLLMEDMDAITPTDHAPIQCHSERLKTAPPISSKWITKGFVIGAALAMATIFDNGVHPWSFHANSHYTPNAPSILCITRPMLL